MTQENPFEKLSGREPVKKTGIEPINFRIEIDPKATVIGFIPQGELVAVSEKPPLAKSYSVLVPPPDAELTQSPEFTKFLNIFLQFCAVHASTIWYVDYATQEDRPKSRYGIQLTNFASLSQYFSKTLAENRISLDLLQRLSQTQIDVASAWPPQSIPQPSSDTFPDFWKAKVFGEEEALVDYLKFTWGKGAKLPKIRLVQFNFPENSDGFIIADSKEFRSFLLDQAIPELLDNRVFILGFEDHLPGWVSYKQEERKYIPISEWEEKADWPNATYAVDYFARSWPSPIIVVDPEDSIRDTHVRYLERWVARFKGTKANVTLPSQKELKALEDMPGYINRELEENWRRESPEMARQIIRTPLLTPPGIQISDEVVAGPQVERAGLLLMLPEKAPLIFKKMLAYIMRDWSGLAILDQYTVGDGERALRAFYDAFRDGDQIQSEKDRQLLRDFGNWLKNLQIMRREPTEDELARFNMAKRQPIGGISIN